MGVLVGTLERERSVRGAGQREGYQAKYFFKRKNLELRFHVESEDCSSSCSFLLSRHPITILLINNATDPADDLFSLMFQHFNCLISN